MVEHLSSNHRQSDGNSSVRLPSPPPLLSEQSGPASQFPQQVQQQQQYGSMQQENDALSPHLRTSHVRGSVLYRSSVNSNLNGMDFLDELDEDAAAAAAVGVLSIIPNNNWTRAERPSRSGCQNSGTLDEGDDIDDNNAINSTHLSKDKGKKSHHHHYDDAEFFDHHQHPELYQDHPNIHQPRRQSSILRPSITKEEIYEELEEATGQARTVWDHVTHAWTLFMFHGVEWDDDGMPYFVEDVEGSTFSTATSLSAWFRFLVFNPIYPEFTAVQQSSWAVIIGITMGIFTALWQKLIENSVEFMWKTIPELLLHYNILTDLNGNFPLPYYMVLCPGVCGCVLSYINVILPTKVPGQNEWIQATHNQGVMDSSAFWHLFFMSTAGMASGMSLGPELPLVLLGGMYGSWLGVLTKQSVLQARVMNLTAGSAIVSGFFGFPMAGGLFVLELPHRMGLQYFEALTPATVSSIMAVITNRMVTGNDVTGYFHYPFMTLSLPSRIFVSAIVYGAFGSLIGVLYGKGVTWLKHDFHGLFHHHHGNHGPPHDVSATNGLNDHHDTQQTAEEGMPLIGDLNIKPKTAPSNDNWACRKNWQCTIPHEPTRAAVVGTICGTLVGITGLFLPHVLFWGESQLQTLIDQGRTPLPIFGRDDEPTANLTAYGYCMVDSSDTQAVEAGFGFGCSALITFAKIWTTGVSLGTGIVAGQFWGPLFTGCAAAQFFTALVTWTQTHLGFGGWLAAHPCVAILCIMGSSHVVTFRTHTAITLILTLTISSFNGEDDAKQSVAGDYSAVFPLLVVAVYVSFILARDYVFYNAQKARGDILALPEVLCQPGKVGNPMIPVSHSEKVDDEDNEDYDAHSDQAFARLVPRAPTSETVEISLLSTSEDHAAININTLQILGLEEINGSNSASSVGTHRRSASASLVETASRSSFYKTPPSPKPPSPGGKSLVRIVTYGELTDHQPSLLEQARARSANVDLAEMKHHRRYPSLPKLSLPSRETKKSP